MKFIAFIFIFLFSSCSVSGKFIMQNDVRDSMAIHKATMRPYVVGGIRYEPKIVKIGYKEIGYASWYGSKFHGKKTSNGEIYNMNYFTAAHKTLPINTIVRVRNLKNNKSVLVRINDRGPFVKSRIIDLSKKAAQKIDSFKDGVVKIELVVLGFWSNIQRENPFDKENVFSKSKFFIQLGVFKNENNAKKFIKNLKLNSHKIFIRRKDNLFLVLFGEFSNKNDAQKTIDNLKLKSGFVYKD